MAETIGSYHVEKTLEQYGETTVYVAKHASTHRLAFLNTTVPGRHAAEWVNRHREIKNLQHPNIMPFNDGGKDEYGILFIAQPFYLPYLRRILTIAEAIPLVEQICSALSAAHKRGLIHGHLTRNHIMAVPDTLNQVVVRGLELLGKPDAKPADDIAALARIICFALTGKENSATIPVGTAAILDRAISGRYGSIETFQPALTQAMRLDNTLESTRMAPPAEATIGVPANELFEPEAVILPRSRAGRGLILALLTLFALVMVGGFGALIISRQRSEANQAIPPLVSLPTSTPSTTATVTPTITVTPLATSTPTNTSTPENTPTATITHTPEASDTPTPTFTATVTFTPSATATAPASSTPPHTSTPSATFTPTFTLTPTVDVFALNTNPCVDLIGDSVTHGGAVYEVPAIGYVFAWTVPMAGFVEQRLKEVGITNLKGIDRGAPNTGISTANHPSYFNTAAYTSMMSDHCRYSIVMPWINDITSNQPVNIAEPYHIQVLSAVVAQLVDANPYGRVIVLNYYTPSLSRFAANTWAAGFNATDIALYNQGIAQACKSGVLSKLPQVSCANTEDAFVDMGTSNVIGLTSRDDLYAILNQPLADAYVQMLNAYYAGNPNGLIQGDGVHLSKAGKTALAALIVRLIQTLPPIPPPTPKP